MRKKHSVHYALFPHGFRMGVPVIGGGTSFVSDKMPAMNCSTTVQQEICGFIALIWTFRSSLWPRRKEKDAIEPLKLRAFRKNDSPLR